MPLPILVVVGASMTGGAGLGFGTGWWFFGPPNKKTSEGQEEPLKKQPSMADTANEKAQATLDDAKAVNASMTNVTEEANRKINEHEQPQKQEEEIAENLQDLVKEINDAGNRLNEAPPILIDAAKKLKEDTVNTINQLAALNSALDNTQEQRTQYGVSGRKLQI